MGFIVGLAFVGALIGLGLIGFGVKLFLNGFGAMSVLVGVPSLLAGLFLIYLFISSVLSIFYPAAYLRWAVLFDKALDYGSHESRLLPLKSLPDISFDEPPLASACTTTQFSIDHTVSDYEHSLSEGAKAEVFEVVCSDAVIARFANISEVDNYRVEYWPAQIDGVAIQKLMLMPPASVVRGRFLSQVVGVSAERVILSHNSGRNADAVSQFDLRTHSMVPLKLKVYGGMVGEMGSELSVFGGTETETFLLYHSKYWSGDVAAFSHVAIVSDRHPEGEMVLTLSVKFGSIIAMARKGEKLYLTVKDRMKGVEQPSYWELDVSGYL